MINKSLFRFIVLDGLYNTVDVMLFTAIVYLKIGKSLGHVAGTIPGDLLHHVNNPFSSKCICFVQICSCRD